MSNIANRIEAKDKTLYSIFSENRYRIDVFQREYRWQSKHIESLIDDLTSNFLSNWSDNHTIDLVDSYDSYYMGPIVLCKDGAECSIVDGQQRLTSFSLLLVYLQHLQKEIGVSQELNRNLCEQLYIKRGGKHTFILNVKERNEVMEQLLAGTTSTYDIIQSIDDGANSESLENLVGRYEDIRRYFPQELQKPETLPLFIEWLLYKVVFVEVMAFSVDNAYTIFETMNDRGLSLNPTEILKAYILSKIIDEPRSEEMNNFWKEKISTIKYKIGNDGDMAFFRSWFRAKYAQTISSRQQGATKEDFEEIGSQFHTWFKTNLKKVGLKTSMDFYYFVKNDLEFYSNAFLTLQKHISIECLDEWNQLYVTNCFPLADSLYRPLMLSPLSVFDSEKEVRDKFLLINDFVDYYINRRQLASKSINQSSIRNYIYDLVKRIRGLNCEELIEVLREDKQRLKAVEFVLSSSQSYSQPYLHYFFARILYLINPKEGFTPLLRSKKQSSYVLYQIYSYEECQDELLASSSFPSWGVANYCLVKRYDIRNVPINLHDRINWLRKSGYMPELDKFGNIEISNFMASRFKVLENLVISMWS